MSTITLNLHFFDGGAGAAGAASAGGAPAGEAPSSGSEGIGSAVQVVSPEQDARRMAYDKAKQEYGDFFKEDFQKQLGERLKGHQQTEKRLKSLEPVMQSLAAKYGVSADDIPGLQAAIDKDDAYYEAEAEAQGLTVRQLKENKAMQAELARLKADEAERLKQDAMLQQMQQWNDQVEKAHDLYPELDLKRELTDPDTGERFYNLLTRGRLDVMDAYEMIHTDARDNRIRQGIAMAGKLAQQQTLDTIRAKGMRPQENGVGGMAPGVSKVDVSKMTREEREEYSRRALRGEKVGFG